MGNQASQATGIHACWITWERHQRSRSLARELGIPLIELSRPGRRLSRYMRNSLTTLRVLALRRAPTVFVQVPSIVLGVMAVTLASIFRFRVIVDAHNAVLEGADKARPPLRFFYRMLVRRADIVIVTNSSLAERVRALGGRPGVLPDPVPLFRADPAWRTDTGNVVVISTWAADEPLEELLQAAKQLPQPLTITITGRPKGKAAEMAAGIERVKLSGFVSDEDYIKMLGVARVVVDLTTREDCLVCGAYEALALGRPLVVSDSRALRELLKDGALYCANDPAAIARTITDASRDEQQWAARCAGRREAYIAEWKGSANRLIQDVHTLRR